MEPSTAGVMPPQRAVALDELSLLLLSPLPPDAHLWPLKAIEWREGLPFPEGPYVLCGRSDVVEAVLGSSPSPPPPLYTVSESTSSSILSHENICSPGVTGEEWEAVVAAVCGQHISTIPQMILQHACSSPSAQALSLPQGTWSYARLASEAWSLGAALVAWGVRRGDKVAILLPVGRMLPLTLLACGLHRLVPCHLSPSAPLRQCQLARLRPAALLCESNEEEPAYGRRVGMGLFLPWYWHLPLAQGGTLVLLPRELSVDIPSLLPYLTSHAVDWVDCFTPGQLALLVDLCPSLPLSHVMCSGEALPIPCASAFLTKFPSTSLSNVLSTTETSADICALKRVTHSVCTAVAHCASHVPVLSSTSPCVVWGNTISLSDESTLVHRGYNIERGYLPPDNSSAFSSGGTGGNACISADRAFWAEGEGGSWLCVEGRSDAMVKVRPSPQSAAWRTLGVAWVTESGLGQDTGGEGGAMRGGLCSAHSPLGVRQVRGHRVDLAGVEAQLLAFSQVQHCRTYLPTLTLSLPALLSRCISNSQPL
ncbi:MAG: hypothetical protein SGPRY_008694 [Prymnesium sp.]